LRDVDYLDDLAGQIAQGLRRYRETNATVALGGAP